MDPNQPTNTKPDYGFIMEQPTGPVAPKKRNPKIILLVVLAIITVGIVALGSLIGPKEKKADPADPRVLAIQSLLDSVQRDDAASAGKAYAQQQVRDETYIKDLVIKPLSQYDLSACTYEEFNKQSTNKGQPLVLVCPLKSNGKKVGFKFNTIETSEGVKILESQIVGAK